MAQEKITKNDIVASIYEKSNCEKRVVQEVVDSFIDELKKNLGKGVAVELRGFGTVSPRLRKGRTGARNPRTGETITIAPHYTAVFKPGQELRNIMKGIKVK